MEAYQLVFLDAVTEESITDVDAILGFKEEFNRLIDDNVEVPKGTHDEKPEDEEKAQSYAAQVQAYKNQMKFYVDNGRLLMKGLSWGAKRPVEQDVADFTVTHPELIVDFIKRGDPNSVLGESITDLSSFWRAKLHKGQIVAEFKPAPLEWQDATAMNWFV